MPLSPPPSSGGEILQHGLHHIVQHNANSPYLQDHYQLDEGVHLQSAYGSPGPGHDEEYRYRVQPDRFTYQQHQHQDSGLGIQYDNYKPDFNTPMYQDHYSTPASSPPTPTTNSHGLRSGYGSQRTHQNLRPMPEGRARVNKSPKPKKAKKEKVKAEKKVAKLEKPLSELTKDWKHVPVADIEAYVNRSAEERRKEVDEGKIPGKVKRPMNSFMLYRKAYQNRTKDWCLQNNHQVVSQVCGDSWPLEPDEVKEKFSDWARIERQNHQNAHPGYKFSPTKPGASKATKRKLSEEPMSEESDLDDYDWRRGPSRRTKKQRPTPRQEQSVAYPTTRSAYHYSSRGNSAEPHGSNNRSSYQVNNPGRPMPAPYNQATLQRGQYYQQTVQNHSTAVGVEDVIIRKAAAPGVHGFLPLPGGQEYDIMNPYTQFNPLPGAEKRLDSSLMNHDQTLYHGGNYGEQHPEGVFFGGSQTGDQHWQAPYGMIGGNQNDPTLNFIDPELDNVQIQDQHAHVLRGHQEGWHIESLDGGPEFEKWMEDE